MQSFNGFIKPKPDSGGAPKKSGDNANVASEVSGTTLKLTPPFGQYDGVGAKVTITDADFVAGKILSGVNLFGLAGSAVERKYATGTVTSSTTNDGLSFTLENGSTSSAYYNITVSGLTFTPSVIIIVDDVTSHNANIIYSSNYFNTTNDLSKIAMLSGTLDYFRLDGTSAYVSGTGFRLPCNYSNTSHTYYAYY